MKENDEQRCRFCTTQEGKVRPVGGFIVRLQAFSYRGQKVMACQKCRQKMKLEDGSKPSGEMPKERVPIVINLVS